MRLTGQFTSFNSYDRADNATLSYSLLMFIFYVKQDFEALTPNLLARTIETVEGGGIVVLLLRTMNSLKQLYTMTMVGLHPVYICMSEFSSLSQYFFFFS